MGMLPVLFWSINSEGPPSSLTQSPKAIYPEHNVLLHCAAHEAQSFMDYASTESRKATNPLSGDVGWEQVKTSYEFLVDLVGKSQEWSSTADDMDSELTRSAALLSMDVMAISLGVDHPDSTKLREHLGSNTDLVKIACIMLGSIVDQLNARTNGEKARELKISSNEQQWLVSLVRLIGNLCYECKLNQDRVRMTSVPLRKIPGSNELDFSRNGLHVILSCTTFWCILFHIARMGRHGDTEYPTRECAKPNHCSSIGCPGYDPVCRTETSGGPCHNGQGWEGCLVYLEGRGGRKKNIRSSPGQKFY